VCNRIAVACGDVASAELLEREARQLLVTFALTSITSSRPLVATAIRRGHPNSVPPTGAREHPAEAWALELERVLTKRQREKLKRYVAALRTELDRVRRRVLAPVVGETLEDLNATIIDRGEDWPARDVLRPSGERDQRHTPLHAARPHALHGCRLIAPRAPLAML
jgi:hypothetical protein